MKWVAKSPEKLSRFLETKLEGHSGKFIRRMLEANLCRVNGKIERFASRRLNLGDSIELSKAFNSLQAPKLKNFKTLFENEDFKVIDKPAGFICSPENTKRAFGLNYLLVHRLDVGTTGLLIIAKHPKAKERLSELFKKRLIEKSYLALVDGECSKKEGTIKNNLVKKGSYHGQTIWGSSPHQGLSAITHYQVLEVGKNASLLLVKPETGRTHQIRVHLSLIGHPILMDPQYAREYRSNIISSRPLLHAYELRFTYGNEEIKLRAPIPEDFRKASIKGLLKMRFLS